MAPPDDRPSGEVRRTSHDGRDPRSWDDDALQEALDRAGDSAWGPVAVIPSTGSTNADAVDQVQEGAPEGFTVVADEQTEGRGRLGRAWTSPYGAGIAMSVVLRPMVPDAAWGWIPLLTGVAVVEALAQQGVAARLKWPNDVVVDGDARDGSPGPRKLGGLLAERSGAAVVVGIGVNVDLTAEEAPVARATSTRLEGVDVQREQLVVDVLVALRRHYLLWQLAAGDPERSGLLDAYRAACLSLGARVRVLLPGGGELLGAALDVDGSGRLLVRGDDGAEHALSAGDVEHLRA
ncbi:MAG: biotin--[acetyl-CoA-carboxylase] ligase [Candidatus Nanopelagicales bacterium]